jgi:hypothetical protein
MLIPRAISKNQLHQNQPILNIELFGEKTNIIEISLDVKQFK